MKNLLKLLLLLPLIGFISCATDSLTEEELRNLGCIAEGSHIGTPDGTVPIESVELGDQVHSVDPETGERVPARVVFIRPATRPCLQFTTSGGQMIRATAEHPFYSPETGRYEQAEKWTDGTLTQFAHSTIEGEMLSVKVEKWEKLPGSLRVFDIGVDSVHRNFVAEGLLVHNKSVVRYSDIRKNRKNSLTHSEALARLKSLNSNPPPDRPESQPLEVVDPKDTEGEVSAP